ncbi:MAG: M23 family metallopeptidase [Treponema sp.]|nr:M23 family metallopeptidase [Treponema sp.]
MRKPASPLRVFLGRVIPLLALLLAAACLLFAVDWSWAWMIPDAPLIKAPEDVLFKQDMISYTGLLPQEMRGQDGEEIPLDMMETFKWQSYRVKRGDSVFKIAGDHAISMDAVIASNGLTNAKKLYEGQELKIPNMDGIPYTVKRGDSLLKISGSMGVPLTAILDANDIESDDISPGTVLFIPGARMKTEDLKLALGDFFNYPIRGKLSSPFGWRNDPFTGVRRYHAAIDLAAPMGTMVKASMDGRVATVGYNATYGKFIILTHSNGFQSLYAHLNATSVSQGGYVSQGAKIGEVGSTGYSTGPHLHFAVYKNGRSVNPLDFLNSGL